MLLKPIYNEGNSLIHVVATTVLTIRIVFQLLFSNCPIHNIVCLLLRIRNYFILSALDEKKWSIKTGSLFNVYFAPASPGFFNTFKTSHIQELPDNHGIYAPGLCLEVQIAKSSVSNSTGNPLVEGCRTRRKVSAETH